MLAHPTNRPDLSRVEQEIDICKSLILPSKNTKINCEVYLCNKKGQSIPGEFSCSKAHMSVVSFFLFMNALKFKDMFMFIHRHRYTYMFCDVWISLCFTAIEIKCIEERQVFINKE